MVIKTIKTNEIEAEMIMREKHHFVIRSDKDTFNENDVIQFQVIKNQKPVTREISNKFFVVTMVHDNSVAPITKGNQLIEFRRI